MGYYKSKTLNQWLISLKSMAYKQYACFSVLYHPFYKLNNQVFVLLLNESLCKLILNFVQAPRVTTTEGETISRSWDGSHKTNPKNPLVLLMAEILHQLISSLSHYL